MNDITPKEAIANLNHLYGMVSPDIQRSLDVAIKALERPQGEWIKEDNGKTTDVYRCSICGRSIMLCKNADLSKYPFCHCGADMRGGT